MKDQQVSTIAMYQVKLIAQGLRTNNNSIQNFSLVWYIGAGTTTTESCSHCTEMLP